MRDTDVPSFTIKPGHYLATIRANVTPSSSQRRRCRSGQRVLLVNRGVYFASSPPRSVLAHLLASETRVSFKCTWPTCTHLPRIRGQEQGGGCVCKPHRMKIHTVQCTNTQFCHYNPRFRACLARHSIPLRLLPARPGSAHFYINHVLVRSWLLFSIFLPQ